jgi:hypothetical protein
MYCLLADTLVYFCPTGFAESKWICLAIYNIAVSSIIYYCIDTFLGLKTPDQALVIRSLLMTYCCTISIAFIFFPKMWNVYKGKEILVENFKNKDKKDVKIAGKNMSSSNSSSGQYENKRNSTNRPQAMELSSMKKGTMKNSASGAVSGGERGAATFTSTSTVAVSNPLITATPPALPPKQQPTNKKKDVSCARS